jgi:hypothetical protein
MMTCRSIGMTLCLVAASASGAVAQLGGTPAALRESAAALSFELPSGGAPGIGVWWVMSDRFALGLLASASFTVDENEAASGNTARVDQLSLSGGPYMKLYYPAHPAVAPFLLLGVRGSYVKIDMLADGNPSGEERRWSAAGEAGLGAEWFPTSRIGVGGWASVSGGYANRETSTTRMTGFFVSTLTSALLLSIYF